MILAFRTILVTGLAVRSLKNKQSHPYLRQLQEYLESVAEVILRHNGRIVNHSEDRLLGIIRISITSSRVCYTGTIQIQ